MEIVKLFQAIILTQDRNLYCKASEMPAAVQSSNLNEELGQIQYIFSDKTGTLTCNVMDFKAICIKGVTYGEDTSYTDMNPERPFVTNVDFKDKNFFQALDNQNHENFQQIK